MKKSFVLVLLAGLGLGAAGAYGYSQYRARQEALAAISLEQTSSQMVAGSFQKVADVQTMTGVAVLAAKPAPASAQAAALSAASIPAAVETEAFRKVFSPEADAHSAVYEVAPGDNLTKIGKKNGVAVGLIKKVNHLASDNLRPGQKLKIPTSKFSVVIDKSQNILILKADEEVLKTYTVSTGTDNSTPVGVFKITDKLVNPTWYKAGAVVPSGSADNVLGTRWMGITRAGYGIHGTTEPEKLGQQVTAGCVRMKNDEVEELYDIITPGTEVTIVD